MADQRLSELPLATQANSADIIYIVQSGVSKRLPVSSLGATIKTPKLSAGDSSLTLISSVPSTSTSTGSVGQIAYNSTHIYLCVATNTWKRAELASW